MEHKKIKAILFDFMGVLLFKRREYVPDKLVDEVDDTIGKVTNDVEFKRSTMEKYKLDNQEFENILDRIVNKYEKFQPIWNILPLLRKRFKLAIINNGTALTLPALKSRHSVDKYFDLFVSSAMEGVRKPDAEMYLLTASKLGIKQNECLFMDDSYKNVEGAKSVGMDTIWWEDKDKGFEKFNNWLKQNQVVG